MKKDFVKESKKAEAVYSKLIIQRDKSKSEHLRKSLNQEINAFIKLAKAFNEYANLLLIKMKQSENRKDEILKKNFDFIDNLSDPLVAIKHINYIQNAYEQMVVFDKIDDCIYEQAIEIYLTTISRDYRDWNAFSKTVLKTISETVIEVVTNINPVISTAYFIAEKLAIINELKKQYQSKDINYLKIDRELLIIEVHSEIMENTANTFIECAEILKK